MEVEAKESIYRTCLEEITSFLIPVSSRSIKTSTVRGRSTGKVATETGKAERVEDAEVDPRREVV